MKNDGIQVVQNHTVVSHEEWLRARIALLHKEKEFTRLRDELNEQRRALPWERVTKPYVFETAHGTRTLEQLFDGRSQLIVYHAMFDPQAASSATCWTQDAACQACSFWADNFNGIVTHLNQRDVTLIAASRAAPAKINATMMGIAFLTLFVANNLMGWIGTFYEQMTPLTFWLLHAGIAAAGGILVLLLGPLLKRILEPHETQGLRPAAMTQEVER